MARKIICQCEDCEKFGLMQAETAFYSSNFPLMNKKYPVCKKCVDKYTDLTKLSGILGILQQLDYPYVSTLWKETSKLYPDATLAKYITEIRRGADTRKLHFCDTEENKPNNLKNVTSDLVTDEIRTRFGNNFEDDELLAMEKKYRFLQNSFDEITSMHTEGLLTFIRYRVKEEFATAGNDVTSAKSWGALARSAATDCGITPNQLSKADLIGGITAFGELVQVVEENSGGVIPIMPEFLQRPRDIPDFTIYNYIDCARHLEGKELISYPEIYEFYDKRKIAFLDDNDDLKKIFKDDEPEEYRPKVEKFLKMPDDESENQVGKMDG